MRTRPKITLTATVRPQIIDLLDHVQSDFFVDSRSRVVEMILLDWLEGYDYITKEERLQITRGKEVDLNA